MSVLQFSPCTEVQLKVDLEIIDHPLGFVLDAGGSLTKLIYRSKKDYNKGKPLKPSDHGILRMKSFTIGELEGLSAYIKENVDICISEEHKDVVWWHTGVTSKSFIKSLQEELNFKCHLHPELNALTRTLEAHDDFKISFHQVFPESVEKASQRSKAIIKMYKKLSEFGNDSKLTKIEIERNLPTIEDFSPGHYFLDLLSTNDYQSWIDKHLPAPTSIKPPFLVLIFGSAGGVTLIDRNFKGRLLDYSQASGKTMHALAELLIGEKDFNKFIQLAQEGNSNNVDVITNDLRKDDSDGEDWYSAFPDNFVAFELGKLSSNNVGGRSKDFSKADLAAGLLSLQLHTLCKIVISSIRISNVYDVYVCGSIFQFPHVRKIFEKHFYSDSLLTSLEYGQLFKLHFFDNPGYLVGLGVWMKNLDMEKLRKTTKYASTI